jgi:hypothetical protein
MGSPTEPTLRQILRAEPLPDLFAFLFCKGHDRSSSSQPTGSYRGGCGGPTPVRHDRVSVPGKGPVMRLPLSDLRTRTGLSPYRKERYSHA